MSLDDIGPRNKNLTYVSTYQNILWKGPVHWSYRSRHNLSIRVLCIDFPVICEALFVPLFSSMNIATSTFSKPLSDLHEKLQITK